ncbi:UDP-3-O-(3-hydroxymyristoyl)glucosamine N-acyltransferase [Chromatocurvus halotolerans]|uniref:UDP-3-O-acylglucosamine N-acyltransferase n=1 Tax=Chromatocurvus halotolerans TaxID=1132028 RepID=A0A4R2L9J6_9GAMM|nr:UDP-3-O-(3-hydroxymyristoyl)glucosamine N-acyltransferase [Chromatocurvus halotolerans]TCO75915.1 UDP-3-O-[3-hydroxymyristoyl] glucosamine N-acyltransferase [Chromatocurvus halotolerans]
MLTLGEVAARLDLELVGDPAAPIAGLASLASATDQDLTFITSRQRLAALGSTAAAAVILKPEWRRDCPVACLLTADPYLAYARASRLFDRQLTPDYRVHPTAIIAAGVHLGASVAIGPGVVIESGVVIADEVVIDAGVFIGANTRIGTRTHLYPNVVLYHGVRIGDDCRIHAGAVIGADGFGYAPGPGGWEKIAQLGGVQLGHRVEVGACSTIDRGALDDTVIDDGVIIDNQVQIAHNCRVGKNTAIAGCVGIAGSTTIGENCTLAGAVGVSGHLDICDNVHLTGQARVTRSIHAPGTYSSGTTLAPTREWARNAVRFTQLDTLERRLAALENAVSATTDKE